MRYLEEKTSIVSTIIENQFPQHVQENNPLFLNFLSITLIGKGFLISKNLNKIKIYI